MSSIYRKYRPKTFAEMVGQNHIKLTLQNELETDSFVHAYLFCGPRGLGKTTAARLFAKAVNCESRKKGESEPCNKCKSCSEINKGQALDLIEIDAASHTGVDNVRENIIENVRFTPHKAKFKVFIIDEVHMLSISAFNALLKTLEEPPEHVIFILCTTEIHRVPETIISRCQRFDFKKLSSGEIIKRLKRIALEEKVKIDDEVFEIIAGKSEGCMRDAETLLGQILSLGSKKINKEQVSLVLPVSEIRLILEMINLLVTDKLSQLLEFINQLVEDGVDLEVFVQESVEFMRKLILIKLGVLKSEWLGLDSQTRKESEVILEYVDLAKLAKMIKVFLRAGQELKNASIIQLPLELAVIEIIQPGFATQRLNPANVGIKKNVKEGEGKETKATENKVKKSEVNPDLEKIKKNWAGIITQSQKKNRDLMFINQKMVWPLEFENGQLIIGFAYDLHRERFEKNSNQEVFVQTIKEVLELEVKLKAKTLKPSQLAEIEMSQEKMEADKQELTGTKVTEENILDAVLESFQGEIVEE